MTLLAVNALNTTNLLTIETPMDFSSSREGLKPLNGINPLMAIYQRRGVKITVENQQYNADLSLHLVSGTTTLRCPFFGSKPYIFNSNSEDARQLEAKMRIMFLNADKGVPYENR